MRARTPDHRRYRLLGVVVALALAAAACGGGDETGVGAESEGSPAAEGSAADTEQEGTGGILRIAMSAGNIPIPVTPSPTEGGEGLRFVGLTLFDGLTRLNVQQGDELPTPEPALAESWEVNPEATEWTFHLREGVTFSDGTPWNADAAVFNFRKLKDPEFEFYDELNAPRAGEQLRTTASWEKVDDYTIKVTTTQPDAWLHWRYAQVMMASPTAVETYGNEDFAAHASGTGPFIMTRYVDGEVMEMEANPNYWRGRPKLDGIVLYPQPEAASRTASLQSGEVDWAEVPSPDSLQALEAEGFQIFLKEYPHCVCLAFNMFKEEFQDPLLRQALNYAADREGLAKILSDTAVPADQYLTTGHYAYADGVGYTYDPEKAKELLAQAGYEPGELNLTLAHTISGSGNMYPNTMVEKLQQDFAAVGVGLEFAPFEWGAFIQIGQAGLEAPENADYDLLWRSPGSGMFPFYFGRDFYCSRPGDQLNVGGYCNPEVDALYDQASATTDWDESVRLLTELERTVTEDTPWLFWMHDLNLRVLGPNVHGYVHPQSWYVDFMNIWVE